MATVESVLGDITRQRVDAIVNAANTTLRMYIEAARAGLGRVGAPLQP